MASSTIIFGSDALFSCDPCKSYNKTEKDAVIYCPDCKDYLCADCKVYHEKLSPTKQHETRALGLQSLSVRSPPVSSSASDTATTEASGAPHPAPVTRPPVLSMQFDASLDTDTKPCKVSEILMLKNVIIILDCANKAMKVFDKQNYCLKYSVNAEGAYNAVLVNEDEMFVTGGKIKSVSIFTFSDKAATLKKKFITELPCFRLCYSKEQNLLYIVCKEIGVNKYVALYTPDGTMTRRIEPLQSGSRALLHPCDIAISPVDKRIYVTDHAKGLVILSPTGKFDSVVNPKELKIARSIAIDRAGQVYFTGLNSDNVFVLPPGGRDATVLISEGIPAPECIAVDGNQLAVGCRDTNLMKIFEFN